MKELEVQELVKRYGNNLVVDKISFHVDNGEFFVLLGPSGGGKSTTLRMISGLEAVDSGRILMHNNDVTQLTPRQRNLAMVFQDYGIYPNMDVYGNIAYGLEARGFSRSEVEKRVVKAAEMLGLHQYLKKSAVDLSGGEQQRVALARAMVKDADLYLYDEPLANLDAKLRYQARRDILNVHRAKQKPTVYVTHDQTEALAIADRIAVIAKGRLQQVGTPDEILNTPSNVFMARFIGTPPMNLISGKLVHANDSYTVEAQGLTLPIPASFNQALQQYSKPTIVAGIRPTSIIPEWNFKRQEEVPGVVVPVLVVDVEPLIGETITELQLNDDTTLRAIFEDAEEDVEFNAGDTIKVAFNTDSLCLFDPETEEALKA